MARRLSRNQRQNLARRERKEEEEKRPSTAGRIVLYLRAATALSSAFSAVTLMLLPDAFPYFVVLVYAAILFWTIDLTYELRGQGHVYQYPPLIVGVAVAAIFSIQFVIPKLNFTEFAWSTNGAYPSGANVYGIKWRSKFSDVHVTVSNDSDRDYAQVNLLINPQYPVIAAALVSALPNTSLSSENPITSVDLQILEEKTGTRTDIPVDWFASTGGFRVRTDVLPAHSPTSRFCSR